MALKRSGCAGLGIDRRSGKDAVGREPRSVGEKLWAQVQGVQWRMEEQRLWRALLLSWHQFCPLGTHQPYSSTQLSHLPSAPAKRCSTFNRLRGIISQNIELKITSITYHYFSKRTENFILFILLCCDIAKGTTQEAER